MGREPSGAVAVSKYFRAEESWTGKATWWFDLPIKKVKNNRRGIYYLLGKKRKSGFVVIGLVVGKFVNSESSRKFNLAVFDCIAGMLWI